MYRQQKEEDGIFLGFHAIFAVICAGVLMLPLARGIQFGMLVLLYNIVLPLLALKLRQQNWLSIWQFVLPLSIFQVFPDWFLSAQLKTLVFPEDGLFKIGTVSSYMALLWVIPLFIIVYSAEKVRIHIDQWAAFPAAGIIGMLIFGTSEATLWQLGSWHAQNVKMLGHIALYVIPAEFILSMLTYTAYRITLKESVLVKILAALLVMFCYSGALNFFYFFIERLFKLS
jgi:hypothetical protein